MIVTPPRVSFILQAAGFKLQDLSVQSRDGERGQKYKPKQTERASKSHTTP